MSAHQEVHPHSLNRLLASLPSEELKALHPHMEQVSLSHGQRLILPHEPIPFVYFPLNSLLSLVTVMEDGSTVEAGSIGREGMAEVCQFFWMRAQRLLKRLRKSPVKPCVSKPRSSKRPSTQVERCKRFSTVIYIQPLLSVHKRLPATAFIK